MCIWAPYQIQMNQRGVNMGLLRDCCVDLRLLQCSCTRVHGAPRALIAYHSRKIHPVKKGSNDDQ